MAAPIIDAGDTYQFVDSAGNTQSIAKAGLTPEMSAQLASQVVPQTPPEAIAAVPQAPTAQENRQQIYDVLKPAVNAATEPFVAPFRSAAEGAADIGKVIAPYVSDEAAKTQWESQHPELALPKPVPQAPAPIKWSFPPALEQPKIGASFSGVPYGTLSQISRNIDEQEKAQKKAFEDYQVANSKLVVKQQSALDASIQLGEQKAAEESALREKAAQDNVRIRAANQEDQKRHDAELNNKQNDINSMIADINNTKINPDVMGWGETIGAAISAGLVQYANIRSGNGGAPNVVLGMLDKEINRRMDIQREALQNKKNVLSARQNLYGIVKDRFDTDEQRKEAFRIGALEDAKMKIDSVLSEYNAPEKQVVGEQMKADLTQKQNDAQMRLLQNVNDELLQREQVKGTLAYQRGQLAIEEEKAHAKEAPLSVPGLQGRGISKEAQEKAAELHGNTTSLVTQIDDLIKNVKETNWQVFPTSKAIELQTKARNIQLDVKKANELGTLDKGAEIFMNSLVDSDPTQFRTSAVIAKLEALKANSLIKEQEKLKPFGFAMPDNRPASFTPGQ